MTTTRTRPPGGDRRPQRERRPRVAPTGGRPEPPVEAGQEDIAPAAALPRLLKGVGAIVAPTTVITGLLFYFGRQHAYAFYWHFGVNFTVLDLTTTDFLVRSADGLFVPIAVVAAGFLVALWAHRLVFHRLATATASRVLHVVAPAAAVAGSLLVAFAVALVVADTDRGRRVLPEWIERVPGEVGGMALAVGVVLLVYAVRLGRRWWDQRRPPGMPRTPGTGLAEWGAAFVLVTVGLFWAVGSYAAGVGKGRAADLEERLVAWPDAVVFSERSLSLDGPGITRTTCEDADTAYRFRYDGLKLVQQAGGHYLLLPASWTPSTGSAILLPRAGDVRLEFARAGQAPASVC